MDNMNEQGYQPQNTGYEPQQNYGRQEVPPVKPNNNLILAIFTTLCCCLPFGIVAIVKASKVDSLFNTGQYLAAQNAADEAKKWSLIGIGVGVVVSVIYMALYGFALFASLSEHGL